LEHPQSIAVQSNIAINTQWADKFIDFNIALSCNPAPFFAMIRIKGNFYGQKNTYSLAIPGALKST
jgi:hypothetical protein